MGGENLAHGDRLLEAANRQGEVKHKLCCWHTRSNGRQQFRTRGAGRKHVVSDKAKLIEGANKSQHGAPVVQLQHAAPPGLLVRLGARAQARGELQPVRVSVKENEGQRKNSGGPLYGSDDDEQGGRGAAVGQHVEQGAKLGRLVEDARRQTVGCVQHEGGRVVRSELGRRGPVRKSDGGEDHPQIADYVRNEEQDGEAGRDASWPRHSASPARDSVPGACDESGLATTFVPQQLTA